jgi:hypothetical protein
MLYCRQRSVEERRRRRMNKAPFASHIGKGTMTRVDDAEAQNENVRWVHSDK